MSAKKVIENRSKSKQQYRILITLTEEEYKLLEEINSFNGKPMAAMFMECVRALEWSTFLTRCYKVAKIKRRIKGAISSKYKEHSFLVED